MYRVSNVTTLFASFLCSMATSTLLTYIPLASLTTVPWATGCGYPLEYPFDDRKLMKTPGFTMHQHNFYEGRKYSALCASRKNLSGLLDNDDWDSVNISLLQNVEKLVLYEHSNFKGRSLTLTRSNSGLGGKLRASMILLPSLFSIIGRHSTDVFECSRTLIFKENSYWYAKICPTLGI